MFTAWGKKIYLAPLPEWMDAWRSHGGYMYRVRYPSCSRQVGRTHDQQKSLVVWICIYIDYIEIL